ncbi:MAG: TrkA family potassium uptake protein, partial [Candidatus Velthaea sp.]
MRQFNRTLGRKIEGKLPNCSVLSLAFHAASTFAAAALDPSVLYAVQFPDVGGVLVGFARRPAGNFNAGGLTLAEAQDRLQCRIVGVAGEHVVDAGRVLSADEEVLVFGRVERLAALAPPEPPGEAVAPGVRDEPAATSYTRAGRFWRGVDPILKRIAAAAFGVFALAVVYFGFALQRDPVTAAYFVVTTMTTVGYGDVTPLGAGPLAKIAASVIMIAGVAISGIFIAFATSALTRAQWTATQGMRQIKTRGHVVVCGGGNVGTRVIEFLLQLDRRLVVIDRNPGPALVEASRNRRFELLTGDATSDLTLDLCNIGAACALIALTDSDTANLEVTLGARARNPQLPVVMRVADDVFARSIARQFGITTTFSSSALSAPAFAGLSRFPGSRGRLAFGNDEYNIGEREQGEVPMPPPAEHCIALGVWRKGRFAHIDAFDEMEPYDRLIFLVPLSQFRPSQASAPRADSAEPVAP